MGRNQPRRGTVIAERSDEALRALLVAYVRHDDDAFEPILNMIRYDPNQGGRFIELARQADLTPGQLAYIAAGPVEDLMGRYGAEYLERVEAAARQDPKMRFLVATVWRGHMSETVWRSVEEMRARLGIEPL